MFKKVLLTNLVLSLAFSVSALAQDAVSARPTKTVETKPGEKGLTDKEAEARRKAGEEIKDTGKDHARAEADESAARRDSLSTAQQTRGKQAGVEDSAAVTERVAKKAGAFSDSDWDAAKGQAKQVRDEANPLASREVKREAIPAVVAAEQARVAKGELSANELEFQEHLGLSDAQMAKIKGLTPEAREKAGVDLASLRTAKADGALTGEDLAEAVSNVLATVDIVSAHPQLAELFNESTYTSSCMGLKKNGEGTLAKMTKKQAQTLANVIRWKLDALQSEARTDFAKLTDGYKKAIPGQAEFTVVNVCALAKKRPTKDVPKPLNECNYVQGVFDFSIEEGCKGISEDSVLEEVAAE